MPKEAASPLPLGRSPGRAGHQPQASVYGSRSHQQPPTSYHHLQQYHHLPRPQGYQYYPSAGTYGQNEPSSQSSAQTSSGSHRDVHSNYEHSLKMTAKYYASGFKMTPSPYETRQLEGSSPGGGQAVMTSQHKPTYDRSGHNVGVNYNRTTATSQYDHKMASYPGAIPYDRFSKKKLAAHVPEKPMLISSVYSPRADKKNPASPYDRPSVPSTSYERLTTKVTMSSPVDRDKSPQALTYDRHKAARMEYASRERHRRPVDSAEHHGSSEVIQAPMYDQMAYESSVVSSYERIAPPSQTVQAQANASTYNRQVSVAPTSSYDRLPMSSTAYERRAVFDRAYEVAAYERRLFPPAAFTSLNSAYYATNPDSASHYPYPTYGLNYSPPMYSRGSSQNERQLKAEDFEAKDNMQTTSTYPAKPRMSLLTSPEYLSSLSRRAQQVEDCGRSGQTSVIVPPARSPIDGSAVRKVKLREGTKPEPLPPLTIDTSVASPKPDSEKTSIYMPTVEPISPTSPPDAAGDDPADGGSSGASVPRSSAKDILLMDIARVDREINKIEHHIFNLKRKQVELEQKAKKIETDATEETTEGPLPQHFSLSHKVYSENRRKAKEAHAALSHLGPSVDLPLYNQPSDTCVYQENKRRHLIFKGKLISYLRKKRREKRNLEIKMTEEYTKKTEVWNRLVEKMENNPERRRKEAENRELFEKTFPKIRKEREDRERFLRVGSRVKSDADLEEIMDNLHEQEMEIKKMRDYAAVPPMLLSAESRRCIYVNTNGLIEDFPSEYKERRLVNVWTDAEKEIFREKYLTYPKNFGAVSSFIEKKSVSDCVQHYYLSKKTENYKRLLKKSGQKSKAGRSRNKSSAAPLVDSASQPVPPTPAIAPRFQRDYKPEGPPPSASNVVGEAEEERRLDEASPMTEIPLTSADPHPTSDRETHPEAPSDCPPKLSQPDPPAPAPPDISHPAASSATSSSVTSATISAALSSATSSALTSGTSSVPASSTTQALPGPPTLKPLSFPEIPIVVIDDSDDSNSSSNFSYIRK